MIVGHLRSCYQAPCRWYQNGPVGRIRYYFADPEALFLPYPTVFWPYSQVLQLENAYDPGEITGYRYRAYDKGQNFNLLQGNHAEGSAEDFAGEAPSPT
jgi:hypothetical protein